MLAKEVGGHVPLFIHEQARHIGVWLTRLLDSSPDDPEGAAPDPRRGRKMTSGTDTRLHDSFRLTSRIAAAASVVVGVIVLAGWALGISFFKSLSPNLASMKANTALCYVLPGAKASR